MIFSKKIILGTANFINPYGIFKNKVAKKDIKSILNFAKKNNINYLDTANDYGQFDKKLYKVIKKFKIFKKFDLNSSAFRNISNQNIKRLKQKKLRQYSCFGLTLRQPNILLKAKGRRFFKILNHLRNKGFIKKIGISIYCTADLKKIIKNFKIDYIQVPLNIVNKKVYQSTKNIIKKRKIEIHVRSVFLQGLLLKKNNQLPTQLKSLKPDWKKIDTKFKKLNISRYTACLNFVMNQNVDQIIFGVTSSAQLRKILKVKEIKKDIPFFSIKNKKLIDPIYWLKNL